MVKRYDPAVKTSGKFSGMWNMEDGDWILYEDYASELATLRAENERLREALAKIGKTYAADNGRLINSERQIATIAKEALK